LFFLLNDNIIRDIALGVAMIEKLRKACRANYVSAQVRSRLLTSSSLYKSLFNLLEQSSAKDPAD